MTARVIFLTIWVNEKVYQISEGELRERLKLQGYLENYRAEIEYQSRSLNEYQKAIFKENSHNNLRASWRIINGEK